MSSVASIQSLIANQASAAGLNTSLALSVAQQESGFNQNAAGSSGEIGTFQLMPGTAADLGVNPYDLAENVQGGVSYLQQMINRYGGNTAQGVAAYNAGPGTVDNAIASLGAEWFSGLPSSTQAYVNSVLGRVGSTQLSSAPASSIQPSLETQIPSSLSLPSLLPTSSAEDVGVLIAAAAVVVILILLVS